MSTRPQLDRHSLIVGALADIIITLPAGLIGNLVGEDSNATIILTVIVLIAPFVAGLLAARGHRATSLTHGGVAAGVGWAVVIAVQVMAKLITGNGVAVIASMTLGVWSVSLGLIGGYVTFRRELKQEIPINILAAAAARRTVALVEAMKGLSDTELNAPSALAGWSRLTIACHLRYGAEALSRMTEATLTGRPAAYYPGGRDRRRPDTLHPAPGEHPAGVVESLAHHCRHLTDRWSALTGDQWNLHIIEPPDQPDLGALSLYRLSLLRLTEVEVHGTDLDVGLGAWSDTFVGAALPFRLDWLNTRRSNHRPFDEGTQGSWLLTATDGPTYLVTVEGTAVRSRPVTTEDGADASARIEGSSRDLLALLLGRPVERPLLVTGDAVLGRAFSRVFPGP